MKGNRRLGHQSPPQVGNPLFLLICGDYRAQARVITTRTDAATIPGENKARCRPPKTLPDWRIESRRCPTRSSPAPGRKAPAPTEREKTPHSTANSREGK